MGLKLLLKILSYPGHGFQDTGAGIKVKINRSGEIRNFKIRVREKGRIISEHKGTFGSGEFEKVMSVNFIPTVSGKKVKYIVEVFSLDTRRNSDSKLFRMSVFKSKIKVLFISGRPGWEYRNIRAFIKSSPKIDLTSFVILRNPEDYIPFPEKKKK